jgi:hypothetical protein
MAGFVTLIVLVDGNDGAINSCWLRPVSVAREWTKESWSDDPQWGQCDVAQDARGLTIYLEMSINPSYDGMVCLDDVSLDKIGPVDPRGRRTKPLPQYVERERRRVKAWYSNATPQFVNLDFEQE